MMAPQFRVVLCGGMTDDEDNFAAPSPIKTNVMLRFRVVLCSGMTDDEDNFAAPSSIKTNDGTAISRCIVRRNGG